MPQGSPPSSSRLSTWELRVLLALHRHLDRQRWVAQVVEQHLNLSTKELARSGSLAHPEPPRGPSVPGVPGWSYYFHGVGCCLKNENGTVLDVDFDEFGAESIDPWFYDRYLRTAPLEPLERTLSAPEPFEGCWMVSLSALRAHGLIEGSHRVRLTTAGQSMARSLDAQTLVDYVFSERELASRIAQLKAAIASRDYQALLALALLNAKEATTQVDDILRGGPIDALTSAALKLVRCCFDARDHFEALLSLAERASGSEPPHPHVRVTCAELAMASLAPHSSSPELTGRLLGVLRRDAHAEEGAAALLHTLVDPDRGMPRLARALQHDAPLARAEAVAALLLLGTAEAAEVLRDSESNEAAIGLALLRGDDGDEAPPSMPRQIQFQGHVIRIFDADNLRDANLPKFVKSAAADYAKRFGPLVKRWLAS